MSKKVDALKLLRRKIDEKIMDIETKLFSESNDQTTHKEKKEKNSIYKYNIG
jgi:hypothetical protein